MPEVMGVVVFGVIIPTVCLGLSYIQAKGDLIWSLDETWKKAYWSPEGPERQEMQLQHVKREFMA